MESNNDSSGLSSYFHHQLHRQSPPPPTASAVTGNPSPANGVVPNSTTTTNMAYLHIVPSAVSSSLETVKRKRGRPRKYGTPEQAATAKRLSGSSVPKKRDNQDLTTSAAGSSGPYSYLSKNSQLAALGNIVQGFTPHIITVSAGEDVGQKIMGFLQQSKRDMCIISASGSVSNASLRQPSTPGGTVTYEGQFDILCLSGSYMCTELSGRTGGLSVCLSSTDGQIIGGGVGGPLTAAGPIQVIVGTFLIDTKKDMTGGVKGDATARKFQPPVGEASVSGVSFRPPSDSPNQNVSGNQFMIHRRNMQFTPTDSMDWRGKTGHSALDSPENCDYEPIPE